MYANKISNALKDDVITKKYFKGVYARNELPTNFTKPACFVLNTQPRGEEGEHWLAIHYDERGRCQFFDSYALHPGFYNLEDYLNSTSTSWSYNEKRLQGKSDHCGYYCIIFLYFCCRDQSKVLFDYFNNDYHLNDRKIDNYIKYALKSLKTV